MNDEDLHAIASVLGSEQGRRALWALQGLTHFRAQSFVAGGPDVTAFREGKRSVGEDMDNVLAAADRPRWRQMQEEAYERNRDAELAAERRLAGEDPELGTFDDPDDAG